ncbi:MAG TPA: aminoglycoside phosphotransferase family protein, partial [Streptomyces sp.]|nr:aminoglycoside phosphotransferase family protein [Streptomyces sp.]
MPSAVPLDPPQRLVRSLSSQHGHAGEPLGRAGGDWLEGLPSLLARMLDRWDLRLERVVSPGGRSSLVALVQQADGSPAALKLLAPYLYSARERAEQESTALTCWNGWGAVRLLRSDAEDGALLLERLHGEMSLRSLPEAKATLEAASAARRLWVSPLEAGEDSGTGGLRTVAANTAASSEFLRSSTPEEAWPLRDEALEIREALLADPSEEVLLHG